MFYLTNHIPSASFVQRSITIYKKLQNDHLLVDFRMSEGQDELVKPAFENPQAVFQRCPPGMVTAVDLSLGELCQIP